MWDIVTYSYLIVRLQISITQILVYSIRVEKAAYMEVYCVLFPSLLAADSRMVGGLDHFNWPRLEKSNTSWVNNNLTT